MKKKRNYSLLISLAVLLLGSPHLVGQFHKKKTRKEPRYWWRVELNVNVTGKYNHQTKNNRFKGHYSFNVTVFGTMQTDEDDYILVQAFQETKHPQWQHIVYNGNTPQTFDLDEKLKPDFTLNYVFKQNGTLFFDHDFQPIPIPSTNPIINLHLPESAGNRWVSSKGQYNNRILGGSNRVTIKDKTIYKTVINNRSFHWVWREKNHRWNHRHDADVSLKIVRMPMRK
ncbi:MAG: hypothetical protein GY940_13070 [bacterium]|nr:hypothetical protein [bacterium]